MDLSLSDEQRLFADTLDRFLKKEYAFERRRALGAARVWGDSAIWAMLAELGCFGLAIPEAAGGFGGSAVDIGLMTRVLGRHLVLEPVIPAIVAGRLLGAAKGVELHIESLIAGSARYAPMFGMDVSGGTLSGSARSVAGAIGADHLLVATQDGLYLVEAASLDIQPVRLLDDRIAGDIVAEGAPASRLDTGEDWDAARAAAVTIDRIARSWEAFGSMEGALAATSAYVHERVQFGQPLVSFQVVEHRLAEMVAAAKEAEMGTLLAALTFDALGSGGADRAVAAMLARTAAAGQTIADGAVQLHGGMGVSDELDVSARFRQLQAFAVTVRADRPAALYRDAAMATRAHHRSAVLIES